ncbi:hypothetical protein IW261DRAFT_1427251, partial [Armillaria novae-zelandiae]
VNLCPISFPQGGVRRWWPKAKFTISSQTEIGQAEESVKVPKQRAYTGSKPILTSSVADIPCCCLGIQGLLDLLNSTLGTSYTLDNPSRSSVLEDCIVKKYDFGTAYSRLRSVWGYHDIQRIILEREAKDIELRRKAVEGNRIYKTTMRPRRVWDLYSNRVVPSWCCEVAINFVWDLRPISHAWVDEVDRIDVWTPINGREWPVPIPKGANLDLIRIEMLNLGLEEGQGKICSVEEWKLDVPTIGAIYQEAHMVCYLSGLGLPLSVKEGDLESDRCWFRRAWTLQERYPAMQHRISTYPIDRVAGLRYFFEARSIPAYYESQSLEDAWTALVNVMDTNYRRILFFTYPEPGTGCKKWRPSWKQMWPSWRQIRSPHTCINDHGDTLQLQRCTYLQVLPKYHLLHWPTFPYFVWGSEDDIAAIQTAVSLTTMVDTGKKEEC